MHFYEIIKNDEDDCFKGFHIYGTNIKFHFHFIFTNTSQFVFSL